MKRIDYKFTYHFPAKTKPSNLEVQWGNLGTLDQHLMLWDEDTGEVFAMSPTLADAKAEDMAPYQFVDEFFLEIRRYFAQFTDSDFDIEAFTAEVKEVFEIEFPLVVEEIGGESK